MSTSAGENESGRRSDNVPTCSLAFSLACYLCTPKNSMHSLYCYLDICSCAASNNVDLSLPTCQVGLSDKVHNHRKADAGPCGGGDSWLLTEGLCCSAGLERGCRVSHTAHTSHAPPFLRAVGVACVQTHARRIAPQQTSCIPQLM
jgi:hypothetical protein